MNAYSGLSFPVPLAAVTENREIKFIDLSQPNLYADGFTFSITQLQLLRKRHDSAIPCNADFDSNVDILIHFGKDRELIILDAHIP